MSKLSKSLEILRGRRNPSDLNLFWHRPGPQAGGEFANRLGLQPLRSLWKHLRHRPRPQWLSEQNREAGLALIRDGYVVLEDFLPDDQFAEVRAEYDAAMDPASEFRSDKVSGGAQFTTSPFHAGRQPGIDQFVVSNARIWNIVSAARGIRLKYAPGSYLARETRAEGHGRDTDNNIVLHKDVHYPTFKAFFLLNRNDASNGAYVTVPGTHRLDWARLQHEYLYSIDIARQRAGKSVRHPVHENGRLQVHGVVYPKSRLREIQIEAGPNALVIANTMSFHRRGGTEHASVREQIRMSFRCVETLHHGLYPRLGTARAKAFLAHDYF